MEIIKARWRAENMANYTKVQEGENTVFYTLARFNGEEVTLTG
jgi:hypothetical protein